MNNEDYTIDNLINVFEEHHTTVMIDREKLKIKISEGLIEKAPWMDDHFSISMALHVMCKEIKRLRDERV